MAQVINMRGGGPRVSPWSALGVILVLATARYLIMEQPWTMRSRYQKAYDSAQSSEVASDGSGGLVRVPGGEVDQEGRPVWFRSQFEAELYGRQQLGEAGALDSAMIDKAGNLLNESWQAYDAQNYTLAAETARQSEEAWPSASAAYLRAEALVRLKDYKTALKVLEARREHVQHFTYSQKLDWENQYAAVLFFNDRFEDCLASARAACDMARGMNSDPDIYTLELQAYALIQLERDREAVAVLNEAGPLRRKAGTEDDPSYVQLRAHLLGPATGHSAAGTPGNSVKLVGGEADMVVLRQQLPTLYNEQRYEEALTLVERAIAARRDSQQAREPWLTWQRAVCLMWSQRPEEALGAFIGAEEIYAQTFTRCPAELYYDKATCFHLLARMKDCRETAQAAKLAYKAEGTEPPPGLQDMLESTSYGRIPK